MRRGLAFALGLLLACQVTFAVLADATDRPATAGGTAASAPATHKAAGLTSKKPSARPSSLRAPSAKKAAAKEGSLKKAAAKPGNIKKAAAKPATSKAPSGKTAPVRPAPSTTKPPAVATAPSAAPALTTIAPTSGQQAAGSVDGVIRRAGDQLTLNGQPYRFVGINAYSLATFWSINAGCGTGIADDALDAFFASLRSNSVVRFWAFQSFVVNRYTGAVDWTPIDRVVSAAARHGVRLVFTLSDQAGTCDDNHWHDAAWYSGAYRQRFSTTEPWSFDGWVHAIVARYAASPAVAMWEPVNEPEASNCAPGISGRDCYGNKTCPAAAPTALRSFFDVVGAEIHALDPAHLVSSGTLAQGECGNSGTDWEVGAASPQIDVLSVHSYDPGGFNATLQARLSEASRLGKPLMLGEWGGQVSQIGSAGCPAFRQARAAELQAMLQSTFSHPGVVGVLPWYWTPGSGCSTAITSDDPYMSVINGFAF